MFCPKCGATMPDDASFCPNCGTSTPAIAGTAPPPAPANELSAPGNVPLVLSPAVAPQSASAVTPPNEDKAVISLVLGVLSLVGFSILAGIPAIILGKMSRDNIRASAGRLGGQGMATAGMVLGWVSVGLAIFVILLIVLMVFYLIPTVSR
jgi:hypothetical protein